LGVITRNNGMASAISLFPVFIAPIRGYCPKGAHEIGYLLFPAKNGLWIDTFENKRVPIEIENTRHHHRGFFWA